MGNSSNIQCRASDSRWRGFSLVELIVVMVIIGILAGVTASTLRTNPTLRARTAVNLVQRDLAFARELAMSSGLSTWVVFASDGGANGSGASRIGYSMLQDLAGTPGFASAVALRDPSTGRNFLQLFRSADFTVAPILSASFSGASTLGFDFRGRPISTAGTLLTVNGTVSFADTSTVTIRGTSGDAFMTLAP